MLRLAAGWFVTGFKYKSRVFKQRLFPSKGYVNSCANVFQVCKRVENGFVELRVLRRLKYLLRLNELPFKFSFNAGCPSYIYHTQNLALIKHISSITLNKKFVVISNILTLLKMSFLFYILDMIIETSKKKGYSYTVVCQNHVFS